MRKIFILVIALLLLNGCSQGKVGEDNKDEVLDNNIKKEEEVLEETKSEEKKLNKMISGIVLDINKKQLTIKDKNLGIIIVNFENEIDDKIIINNYVEIETTGISTRSIPPQMVGIEILKNELRDTFKGEVIKVNEKSILIKKEDYQQVIVNLENIIKDDFKVGDNVMVTTNGISTSSLPPQTVAIEIHKVLTTQELVESVFNEEIIEVLTDTNREITVNKNDFFTIFLNENPSTGYIYDFDISEISKQLKLIKEEVIKDNEDTILLGQSVNKVWLFKASKEGQYKIEYDLLSPDEEIVDKIIFNINVKN